MKTSELTGGALDWAVAKANQPVCSGKHLVAAVQSFKPSTDWAQGGPIIERQGIELTCWALDGWKAKDTNYQFLDTPNERVVFAEGNGDTPLIAAMRCFVASRLGEEVEVPDELK